MGEETSNIEQSHKKGVSRGIFHLWLGARRIFVLGIQPHCLKGPSRSKSSLAHAWRECDLVRARSRAASAYS